MDAQVEFHPKELENKFSVSVGSPSGSKEGWYDHQVQYKITPKGVLDFLLHLVKCGYTISDESIVCFRQKSQKVERVYKNKVVHRTRPPRQRKPSISTVI